VQLESMRARFYHLTIRQSVGVAFAPDRPSAESRMPWRFGLFAFQAPLLPTRLMRPPLTYHRSRSRRRRKSGMQSTITPLTATSPFWAHPRPYAGRSHGDEGGVARKSPASFDGRRPETLIGPVLNQSVSRSFLSCPRATRRRAVNRPSRARVEIKAGQGGRETTAARSKIRLVSVDDRGPTSRSRPH